MENSNEKEDMRTLIMVFVIWLLLWGIDNRQYFFEYLPQHSLLFRQKEQKKRVPLGTRLPVFCLISAGTSGVGAEMIAIFLSITRGYRNVNGQKSSRPAVGRRAGEAFSRKTKFLFGTGEAVRLSEPAS